MWALIIAARALQTGFFNRGAASERWIPAQQRVRPASAHARAEAGKPAPYIMLDPVSQPQVCSPPRGAPLPC